MRYYAEKNWRLNWQRDSELERTHYCKECSQEVCTEYLTDTTYCHTCAEPSDWLGSAECPECDGRGRIPLSGEKVTEYKDSRSMITHDGKFLCGDCAFPEPRYYDGHYTALVLNDGHNPDLDEELQRPVRNSVQPLTLLEASKRVGRRNGYMTSVAILEDLSKGGVTP